MQRLNQEDILKYIQVENWKPILNFLYEQREEILSDNLLKYSSNIFESEFFKKLTSDSKSIRNDDLKKLFLLHSGNFYSLNDLNYKNLVFELLKRSKGRDRYNYATLFPQDKECQEIIKKYEDETKRNKQKMQFKKISKTEWIEIYNRVFELINDKDDASTYFSGGRFIKTLKEFNKYHPDYVQYIGLRNEQGKSTSRKIFYYDILMDLDEEIRMKFVSRILQTVEPFKKKEVTPILQLLAGQKNFTENQRHTEGTKDESNIPSVFISYSWDDEDHKKWVLELANKLVKEGVNVILDRYHLKPGVSLTHFVESSLSKANRVIIIFTPNYKLKAEKRDGGVGYEYSIMNAGLYENQTENDKIIPILRLGTKTESIPEFMQQYIHIDMRKNENFEVSYNDLYREIFDEPEIVKPEIGKKKKITNSKPRL